jgi:hypothetical protein
VTDLIPLIVAILAGVAVIYLVDDGRIRVAALAILGVLMFWRNHSKNSSNSEANPVQNGNGSIEPIPPDATKVEADAQATDARIDAISHDRPDDPDVRAALELIDAANAKRRDRNAD